MKARTSPFAGSHQPGITTPQQAHAALVAFDAVHDPRPALAAWAALGDGGLTVTVGLGPGLFAPGRLGLEDARPVALVSLPPFARDALDPAASDGDLLVQVCADDPAAVDAAVASLPCDGVEERWRADGYMHRRTPDGRRRSPRNRWGFIEGARNLRRPRDLERHVFAGGRDRPWMRGGTYLVFRRIVLPAAWAALGEAEQDAIMGGHRVTGAPLRVRGSHVDLAAPERNAGIAMLRRSYNFVAGDEEGLLFLAFVRDPRRQFVPLQRRLDAEDPLAAFGVHTASGVFAVPPAGFAGAPPFA